MTHGYKVLYVQNLRLPWNQVPREQQLGGGFQYFLFSPRKFGEMIQFD